MPGALKPLGAGFSPLISAAAQALEARLEDDVVARVATWLDLVVTWNAKVDLTAARSAEELVDLMLADALVLARHEKPGKNVVDVGSGAGGPGLALHLVRPDLAITLVEPLQKRVSFLRTVSGNLPPSAEGGSLRIVRARADDLLRSGATFATAVSRATLPPEEWLRLAARLVVPEGGMWALLAREPPPKIAGWHTEIEEKYRWPLTGAERRALRYVRTER
jgi:16S rRNA (guanine527-N7)-methyltransferase